MKPGWLHTWIICLLCPLLLGGCSDLIEIRELGMVSGMGFDYIENKKLIQLTVQIVQPSVQGTMSQYGPTGETKRYITQVSQGENVYDAFTNLFQAFPKRMILSHNKIVVIGKSLAEKGVLEVADFLLRDREIRSTTSIFVTDTSANEILTANWNIDPVPAVGMNALLEVLKQTSHVVPMELMDFFLLMRSDAKAAYAPLLQKGLPLQDSGKNNTKEAIRYHFGKTAVFQEDRMIGTLTDNEARGLIWLLGKIKGGTVNISLDQEKNALVHNVAFEIVRGKCRIAPRLDDSGIVMDIKCKGVASIREAESIRNTEFDPDTMNRLKNKLEQTLQKRLEHTIWKAQNTLKLDILGFADVIHRDYPQYWKKVKNRWGQVFPDIRCNVTFDLDIDRQGVTKNPFSL